MFVCCRRSIQESRQFLHFYSKFFIKDAIWRGDQRRSIDFDAKLKQCLMSKLCWRTYWYTVIVKVGCCLAALLQPRGIENQTLYHWADIRKDGVVFAPLVESKAQPLLSWQWCLSCGIDETIGGHTDGSFGTCRRHWKPVTSHVLGTTRTRTMWVLRDRSWHFSTWLCCCAFSLCLCSAGVVVAKGGKRDYQDYENFVLFAPSREK